MSYRYHIVLECMCLYALYNTRKVHVNRQCYEHVKATCTCVYIYNVCIYIYMYHTMYRVECRRVLAIYMYNVHIYAYILYTYNVMYMYVEDDVHTVCIIYLHIQIVCLRQEIERCFRWVCRPPTFPCISIVLCYMETTYQLCY